MVKTEEEVRHKPKAEEKHHEKEPEAKSPPVHAPVSPPVIQPVNIVTSPPYPVYSTGQAGSPTTGGATSNVNVTLGGPLASGTVKEGIGSDVGLCMLTQTVTLSQVGTAGTYDVILYLPVGAQILDFILDVLTPAYDSSTSANLTVGKTSQGTDYAASASLKTPGRTALAPVAANVGNLYNLPANASPPPATSPLFATVVEAGTSAAGGGKAYLTIRYIQK